MLPDEVPYVYALPGGRRDRVVVTTAFLDCLEPAERRALLAHERAQLTDRHHRFLLAVQLAARQPLSGAAEFGRGVPADRWADEDAARCVGSRRTVACAIGKAALVSRGTPMATAGRLRRAGAGTAPGGRPARPGTRGAQPNPSVFTAVGLAARGAAAGTAACHTPYSEGSRDRLPAADAHDRPRSVASTA